MKLKTVNSMLVVMGMMSGAAYAQEEHNVFNWSDYITPSAVEQFEK